MDPRVREDDGVWASAFLGLFSGFRFSTEQIKTPVIFR
jgi:hypothetical protein